jgi:hypothetical protein
VGNAAILAAIDEAEIIADPLDNLVERTKENPGLPFEAGTLERLKELRSNSPAEFENLRASLKVVGCRVTELDKALGRAARSGGPSPKQADILIDLACSAELFHTPDKTAYADIFVDGHRETYQLRTKAFRRWLTQKYFQHTAGAPNSEALQSALDLLESRALFDSPERDVFVRTASREGRYYLDLGDAEWRAVEIDADGWRILNNPPVRFRRPPGLLPIPVPEQGGSITTLKKFLNVGSHQEFVLLVSWLLAALRNHGPFPVLVLSGEQGSAKSTLSRMLRSLVDPNYVPLRPLPREERDLFISANNNHILSFDNVSGLPDWLSDSLCRLATGGGFVSRKLYTDQEEVLIVANRPVILNGIEDIVSRPDLLDRAILLNLEALPEKQRRSEADVWASFEKERPGILGALLNAVSAGIRNLPTTHLPKLPRMADFALFVTACEEALWDPGTFSIALQANQNTAVQDMIENDPVAEAICRRMVGKTEWVGSASELLAQLNQLSAKHSGRRENWPTAPNALSKRLTRFATVMRKVGIEIVRERVGHKGTRLIRISQRSSSAVQSEDGEFPSASSALSAANQKTAESTK